MYRISILLCLWCCIPGMCFGQGKPVREIIPLNADWETVVRESQDTAGQASFVAHSNKDAGWQRVTIPHNWDRYEGYRRMKHGNRHGTAWYRRTLSLDKKEKNKRYFLFFEGVGSYATVWVNSRKVGEHGGGRTTFTLDITDAVTAGTANTIVVRAGHPSFITDLPWVCGGCSGEWGFSEGSQPMGIFRPVTLVVTEDIRTEPFGIHIWNSEEVSGEKALLWATAELRNYRTKQASVELEHTLRDSTGCVVATAVQHISLKKGEVLQTEKVKLNVEQPHLWSPENPYLYELSSVIRENGKVVDSTVTPYGIRWVSWPAGRAGNDGRFYLNGNPLFINGTCEYEHLMGKSHAFTATQVEARVDQIKAAGFNAFREAHQPHNLRYQEHLDREGLLFWSQFSAHIWYDTPEFRKNFKTLLKEWIRERRNSPSVVLWGLQNESVIPEAFARECTELIRQLDPTASSQRLVTTCNGGEGTDWNVVQNWSGTYGGDPFRYGAELSKEWLNGEYGAWRTAGLHAEGPFRQKGAYTEERFSQLMEIKVAQAEVARDSVAGQFQWLFSSHENPGRIQNGEGFRDIDRVGPVNYKGLFTVWGEPLDAYYMYMANYAAPAENPMVYIVSHSWPDRWTAPGVKDSIVVYSNCDEVELFNDTGNISLGKKKNPGQGRHFQWDDVPVRYNVLHAVGYRKGQKVTADMVMLHHLPEAPGLKDQKEAAEDILEPEKDTHYLYRVNAGGPEYTDTYGNTWAADTHRSGTATWGSLSWTDDFANLPHFYASQGRTFDPVSGTANWPLFQHYRYGMDRLSYEFPVADGDYTVMLYFTEPWYGTGMKGDCSNWRNFDVAINDRTVLHHLDIWKEAGHDHALKKTFRVRAAEGKIKISFPEITSGQAIIAAIAIISDNADLTPAPAAQAAITLVETAGGVSGEYDVARWSDLGQRVYTDSPETFSEWPYHLFGADRLRFSKALARRDFSGSFVPAENSGIYVLMDSLVTTPPAWLGGYEKTEDRAADGSGRKYTIYRRTAAQGERVTFGKSGNARKGSAGMYSIVVVPEYDMGENDDSRPVFTFEAETASIGGKAPSYGHFKKEDYVAFEKDGNNSISWEVSPGLAGEYLLRFRYMNTNPKAMSVRLHIESSDGIVLRDDEISFPVADVKWKILNTTTGGYINAGTYKITLSAPDMKGLQLDKMEFQ
ncbi:malectin domain-containing carbohydrate-binding protein [Sinomicrobium oceani]|nr:malectin domain-containing carbohydrate-binding protein [Sinomicrobium oceani]